MSSDLTRGLTNNQARYALGFLDASTSPEVLGALAEAVSAARQASTPLLSHDLPSCRKCAASDVPLRDHVITDGNGSRVEHECHNRKQCEVRQLARQAVMAGAS